jgi:hypothetical protein
MTTIKEVLAAQAEVERTRAAYMAAQAKRTELRKKCPELKRPSYPRNQNVVHRTVDGVFLRIAVSCTGDVSASTSHKKWNEVKSELLIG